MTKKGNHDESDSCYISKGTHEKPSRDRVNNKTLWETQAEVHIIKL